MLARHGQTFCIRHDSLNDVPIFNFDRFNTHFTGKSNRYRLQVNTFLVHFSLYSIEVEKHQTTSRFKTLPSQERRIGFRVVYWRKCFGKSQEWLADEAQITLAQLSNIESGRVPLKTGAAFRICKTLDIHPRWLCFGHNEEALSSLEQWQRDWLEKVATQNSTVLFSTVWIGIGSLFAGDEASYDYFQKLATSGFVPKFPADLENERLTSIYDVVKSRTVKGKLHLTTLIKDVRDATQKPGSKTALANAIGVPLATLSQWLSGKTKRMPDGEHALWLRNWVEKQKRKK